MPASKFTNNADISHLCFCQTLDAFIKEAGLPYDAGNIEKDDLTLEKIVEEKTIFDLSLRAEKTGVNEDEKGWSMPGEYNASNPETSLRRMIVPLFPTIVTCLPTSSNLLSVSVAMWKDPISQKRHQLLLATTADRRFNVVTFCPAFDLTLSICDLQDSPILSCAVIGGRSMRTITSGMSGQVVLFDHKTSRAIDQRRDHKKYVVKVDIYHDDSNAIWVATAGWDAKVYLYKLENEQMSSLGPVIAYLTLPTNPETILFIKDPVTSQPILLVSRRDSTSLHYYALPHTTSNSSYIPEELQLLGTQNLAPHSNAWIAFSPCSIVLCPTDPNMLAVATSAVPHMKLIIVRILWPSHTKSDRPAAEPATQAAQTRANLAVQDSEDAAIQIHVSTLAPQTLYSTPQVVWRPDGSGVWVNGDDGVVRGLETRTGKIMTVLKHGHELGSKVRSIWCGYVETGDGDRQEWVVSGGFDRKLIAWRPKKGSGN